MELPEKPICYSSFTVVCTVLLYRSFDTLAVIISWLLLASAWVSPPGRFSMFSVLPTQPLLVLDRTIEVTSMVRTLVLSKEFCSLHFPARKVIFTLVHWIK